MNSAVWGVFSALGWGSADFIARFTGRKLGTDVASFGMMLVGATVLTACVLAVGLPPAGPPIAWIGVVVSGAAIVTGTLLLYAGLARGPVSVVAPIAGAYPIVNVTVSLLRGARPGLLQYAAMAAVLLGVAIVAQSAGSFQRPGSLRRADVRRSVALALAAGVAIAVGVGAAQEVSPVFGQLQTVWSGRIASVLILVALFAARRRAPHVPRASWPIVGLQGILDSGAYVTLLLGGSGPGSEIAVVVGSCFSVVTVVLARILLREQMNLLQWTGVAAIVVGVGTLAAP